MLVDAAYPKGNPALRDAGHQARVRAQLLLVREPGDVSHLLEDHLRRVEVNPGKSHRLLDRRLPSPDLGQLPFDLLHLTPEEVELCQ